MRGWAGRKGGGSAMELLFVRVFLLLFFGKKVNTHKVILDHMLIHRILVKLAG